MQNSVPQISDIECSEATLTWNDMQNNVKELKWHEAKLNDMSWCGSRAKPGKAIEARLITAALSISNIHLKQHNKSTFLSVLTARCPGDLCGATLAWQYSNEIKWNEYRQRDAGTVRWDEVSTESAWNETEVHQTSVAMKTYEAKRLNLSFTSNPKHQQTKHNR